MSLAVRDLAAGTQLVRVAVDSLGTTEPSASLAPRRFSPVTDERGRVIPVLYAGQSLACALGETVFHDLPDDAGRTAEIFRADLLALRAGFFTVTRPISVADLTDAALSDLGIGRAQLIATPPRDYPATAAWGQAAWDTTAAAGLVWTSRRSPDQLAYLFFVDPPGLVRRARSVRRRDDLVITRPPMPLHDGEGLGHVLTTASDRNVTVIL